MEEVAKAAAFANVDTLLVEENKIIAGQIENSSTGIISNGDIDHPATGDLLDDLSELVINQGGKVLILPLENMPTDTGVAAIFRY